MPRRMRLEATLSQLSRDHRSEMVHPTPNGLVRHRHSAFRQQILDVAQTEGEPEVGPYRLANDLGREPVARIVDFPHGNRLSRPPEFGNRSRRDKALQTFVTDSFTRLPCRRKP